MADADLVLEGGGVKGTGLVARCRLWQVMKMRTSFTALRARQLGQSLLRCSRPGCQWAS